MCKRRFSTDAQVSPVSSDVHRPIDIFASIYLQGNFDPPAIPHDQAGAVSFAQQSCEATQHDTFTGAGL
jgi:hypothetical protein